MVKCPFFNLSRFDEIITTLETSQLSPTLSSESVFCFTQQQWLSMKLESRLRRGFLLLIIRDRLRAFGVRSLDCLGWKGWQSVPT